MKVLWTELRRSVAPVLAGGLLLLALGLLYGLPGPWHKGSAPWNEQWTGLARWSRYLLVFVWPLVLGAGAWHGLRDGRSRMTELLATTPRPAWWRVLPGLGAVALGVFAAYAGVLVVGAVGVFGTATYLPASAVGIAAVGVLALVAGTWAGVGIGRLLPSLLTPPVVVVTGLSAQLALVQGGWPQLLTPVFEAYDINVFTTVPVSLTLVQVVWFLAVVAAGYVLTTARGRARLGALVPLAVGLAVALPVLPHQDRQVADPGAQALVCDEDGPRVCVTRAHAGSLAALTGPAREALATFATLPDPPTSVVELVPPAPGVPWVPQPADVALVSLTSDAFRNATVLLDDPDDLRLNVLAGAGTPVCADEDESWERLRRTMIARTVTAAWLSGELRPLPGYDGHFREDADAVRQAFDALRALPPADQRARVAAVRAAGLDCGDQLAALEGTR